MAGLYLHIPYCRHACHYCNFHFSTRLKEIPTLIPALLKELHLRREYLSGEGIESLYIGGGTPSVLGAPILAEILEALHRWYDTRHLREVTVEANPEDMSFSYARDLRAMGINRLSLGVQSFYPPHLATMNRKHSAYKSLKGVEYARAANFSHVSIDLLYGIPHATHAPWQEDLKIALSMDIDHLSAYALTLEPRTVLYKKKVRHAFKPATEDFVAAQYRQLILAMKGGGYEHYEVSNFSKKGARALHNANYWQGKKYLGIGPAAHSYDGVSRQHNVSQNKAYLQAIQRGEVPCTREVLSHAERCNEYLITRLRTQEGIDLAHLSTHFSYDLVGEKRESIDQLMAAGYLMRAGHRLLIPEEKWLLANEIIWRCMV